MSQTIRTLILIAVVAPLAPHAAAQLIDSQQAMHQRVAALYSFHPAKITPEERKEKSSEMDAFWSDVKAKPDITLPLLRVELRNSDNPPFFMVDGSNLLLSLSSSQADRELAAASLAHADLSDVDAGAYFYNVHQLAVEGIDITSAALHILDDPTFAVPVPAHAMTLDQQSALLQLLLMMDPARWMRPAIQRFGTVQDDKARKSLLAAFFYVQTPEGDAMLAKVASDPAQPETVRKDARSYQDDEREALKQKVDVKGTEVEIRDRRRKRLDAVSDEAIDDVQEMTVRIIQLRHQTHGS